MEIVLKPDAQPSDLEAVRAGLRAYNLAAAGAAALPRPFALNVVDPQTGNAVGGMTGWAQFDWLFIELFHLPAELRGQGLGRQLMARAEDFARAQGLVGIWLDTFSFQARPFYEKLGFTVFGTLEDHPVGGRRHFMQKRLEGAS